jgi:hypothetical protein
MSGNDPRPEIIEYKADRTTKEDPGIQKNSTPSIEPETNGEPDGGVPGN